MFIASSQIVMHAVKNAKKDIVVVAVSLIAIKICLQEITTIINPKCECGNHCRVFYYNEFPKIATWTSVVTASVSSPCHNNGYLRPSLDVLDSQGVRRRSRHVAKLNMGEAKDDIHVCIMCLRAIMNNKVTEDLMT